MTTIPTTRERLNGLATYATYSLLAFVAVFSFFVAGDYVSENRASFEVAMERISRGPSKTIFYGYDGSE